MSEKIVQMNMIDVGVFEDSAIIRDDDQYLIVHAVLASEIVQPYRNKNTGKIEQHYKSADELEKATFTFRGIPIKTLAHPKSSHIEDRYEVNGRVENPSFRKDLMEPKTKRPCRRGVDGDLWFYRDNAPEVKVGTYKPITEQLAEAIRKGTLKDNSIGFTSFNAPVSGEWQGQHYDVVQTRIFANHLAAPIEKGRCPSPYCGINVDSAEQDTWETTEENIRSGHGDKGSFDPDSFRTIDITDGIQAVVGCPKGSYADGKCKVGMETQSFLFDKSKFDMAQAKAWFEKHHAGDAAELADFYKCPVCTRIDEIGLLEVGKRLFKQYGADVLEVIEGHELLAKDAATEEEKKAQETRANKYGIAVKEGGNVTKPTEYSGITDGEFADPVNYRYPIDEGHVMAAWAYFSVDANQAKGGYTDEEWAGMKKKIVVAMKKYGHEIAGQKPQDGKDDTAQLISRVDSLVKELRVLFP